MAALAAWHVLASVVPAFGPLSSDFANYYVPARALRDGRTLDRLYERNVFLEESARAGIVALGSFVPHPPANALLLRPFAALGPEAAKHAWTLVLLGCAAGSFLALRPLAPPAWVALVVLLPTAAWSNALRFGQPYPVLLLLLALALRALRSGRPAACGLLLAPVLVLKLYAAPFVLGLAASGRRRAALAAVAGALASSAGTLAVLGGPLHEAYVREVLPASLRGEVQDPYSPVWGSAASLAHRAFVHEPDLNPHPWVDAPVLARAAVAAWPVFVLVLALVSRGRAPSVAADFARWTTAALLVSPLTATYHFVLLVIPAAVLVAQAETRGRRLAVVALVFFCGSNATHFAAPLASGATLPLAYPRLLALAALFALTCGRFPARVVGGAAVAALGVGALGALAAPAEERGWERVEAARGYLAGEPVSCGGRLSWTAVEGGSLVVRDAGGVRFAGVALAARCVDGSLAAWCLRGGSGRTPCTRPLPHDDEDERAGIRIAADGSGVREVGSGGARLLWPGEARRPRLSADGRLVAFESRDGGSWDVRVIERSTGRVWRMTSDAANELEPSWLDARTVVFASDRRRGLASTTLYTVRVPTGQP